MKRIILFITLLSFLYACNRENENKLIQENEEEFIENDVFANIDIDVYNSLVVHKEFQHIAALYKENRDAIYTCEDEELSEQCLKVDTIRSLVHFFAHKMDCPELVLYIVKYVESELDVLSRCLINEKVYTCWDRTWKYYEDKYPNLVYSRVNDRDAVVNALCDYVTTSLAIEYVVRHIIKANRIAPRFENVESMSNYLRSLAIPQMTEKEMHNMNATLFNRFYQYYISGKWLGTGGEKVNSSSDICPHCGYSPCICDKYCSMCHKKYKNCICCHRCKYYPCLCLPSEWEWQYRSFVEYFWQDKDINTYLKNYNYPKKFNYYYTCFVWSNSSTSPLFLWQKSEIPNDIYYIPEFIYTSSSSFAFNLAYILYTNLKSYVDLNDIYSFAKMVKIATEEKRKINFPENVVQPFVAFWITPNETYALVSNGKLGRIDDYLKYYVDDDEKGFREFVSDFYGTEIVTIPGQNFTSLSQEQLFLYRCMTCLHKIGCDIEIYRWDENKGEYGGFIEPWLKMK